MFVEDVTLARGPVPAGTIRSGHGGARLSLPVPRGDPRTQGITRLAALAIASGHSNPEQALGRPLTAVGEFFGCRGRRPA